MPGAWGEQQEALGEGTGVGGQVRGSGECQGPGPGGREVGAPVSWSRGGPPGTTPISLGDGQEGWLGGCWGCTRLVASSLRHRI